MVTMVQSYAGTVEEFAEKAVSVGLYPSKERFLKTLVSHMARSETARYRREISKYERKYGDFGRFTKKIEGKATPKQEDEWMQWESARSLLARWEKAVKELGLSAS